MNSVIQFPNVSAPSMVDPPATDYRTAVIELEHEVADLQVVVAEQAVKLSKRYEGRHQWGRRLRINAVVLTAFMTGWMMEPPVVPALARTNVTTVSIPVAHAPAFWI